VATRGPDAPSIDLDEGSRRHPDVEMTDQLLNTREAARFLRVSEASIRRWTDAGLLATHRVGRRRERRFTEDDLRAFMSAGTASTSRAGLPQAAEGVLVAGVSVPVRSHLPTFYGSDAERTRLSVPFLRDGLRAHQRCILVAEDEIRDRYLDALEDTLGELRAAGRGGELITFSDRGSTAAEALTLWDQALADGFAERPGPMRVVGEMSWYRRTMMPPTELIAFEEGVNLLLKRYAVTTICQYDVREFDGPTLLGALKAHPDLFEHRLGGFLI
jgi:transcriptional repressor of dcmA and dcmR